MGQGAVLDPTLEAVRAVSLLKAPNLSAIPAGILEPLALWPMPLLDGAASFRVQIAVDESLGKIVRNLLVTSGSANLPNLPNGGWFARFGGIDTAATAGAAAASVDSQCRPH